MGGKRKRGGKMYFTAPAIMFVAAIVVVLWLRIRFWAKKAHLQEIKLVAARSVLLRVAFFECRCGDKAISLPDGKPLEKGYCEVCRARAVLEEHYPGTIEKEISERRFHRLPFPENL